MYTPTVLTEIAQDFRKITSEVRGCLIALQR